MENNNNVQTENIMSETFTQSGKESRYNELITEIGESKKAQERETANGLVTTAKKMAEAARLAKELKLNIVSSLEPFGYSKAQVYQLCKVGERWDNQTLATYGVAVMQMTNSLKEYDVRKLMADGVIYPGIQAREVQQIVKEYKANNKTTKTTEPITPPELPSNFNDLPESMQSVIQAQYDKSCAQYEKQAQREKKQYEKQREKNIEKATKMLIDFWNFVDEHGLDKNYIIVNAKSMIKHATETND